MSFNQNNAFLDQMIEMYSAAGLPAVIVDSDFTILWRCDASLILLPSLINPDGVRSLLQGYDLEEIKLEISQRGVFTIENTDNLFANDMLTVCALFPGKQDYYLILPSSFANQGTGMRPKGIWRILSTFQTQFRTPLTIIFSMLTQVAQSCKTDASEEERANALSHLEVINQNTFKVLRNCEWISNYTLLSNGLSPIRLSRVDIFQFLRELFDGAAALIEPSGILFSYSIPSDVVPMVCDIEKVSSAIYNILSNSCRFTRDDNHIHAKVRRHTNSISISITDHGLGIPDEALPHVFEPYYSYNHDGHPFAGTGLGLAIAEKSVSAIGGSITLTSVENAGTTVLFTLPISDDESIPPSIHCNASDYTSDRFSPLRIALSDSIKCPLV